MLDPIGFDGIEFDVAGAPQHVVRTLCQARAEPFLSERAAVPIGAVHILNVALSESFHEPSRAGGRLPT